MAELLTSTAASAIGVAAVVVVATVRVHGIRTIYGQTVIVIVDTVETVQLAACAIIDVCAVW